MRRVRLRSTVVRGTPTSSASRGAVSFLPSLLHRRGTAPEFPHCNTRRCSLGRGIREAFGDQVAAGVLRGARGGISVEVRVELKE